MTLNFYGAGTLITKPFRDAMSIKIRDLFEDMRMAVQAGTNDFLHDVRDAISEDVAKC